MRRPWRREIFLILFCSFIFIIQITLTAGVVNPEQLKIPHRTLPKEGERCHLFCVHQGGVYQFQLLDYYSCSGACIMFGCIIQCVALGWAFGKSVAVSAIIGGHQKLFFLCFVQSDYPFIIIVIYKIIVIKFE